MTWSRRVSRAAMVQGGRGGLDLDCAGPVLAGAKTAMAEGIIGYALLVAENLGEP